MYDVIGKVYLRKPAISRKGCFAQAPSTIEPLDTNLATILRDLKDLRSGVDIAQIVFDISTLHLLGNATEVVVKTGWKNVVEC